MIIVYDFGSQLAHLITRRLRELGCSAEIRAPTEFAEADAYVLSGGPQSVYDARIPYDSRIFTSGKPLLGLCYGHQLIAHHLGGKVVPGGKREYGATELSVKAEGIFKGLGPREKVWMSHGDVVTELPLGFRSLAQSSAHQNAAFCNPQKLVYGLQFHPEVEHTTHGMRMLRNFVDLAGVPRDWNPASLAEKLIAEVCSLVGDAAVIMAVSGGVDSLVASTLIHRAIGERLHCVYVDTGLMRKGDTEHVRQLYKDMQGFEVVNAEELFLSRLKGVADPEEKRKIIGHTFIDVFEKAAKGEAYLGQGTIYPDRIESAAPSKNASKIKSHHNLTLPERMKLKLVEPLRDLYKDEVRALGRELGIPDDALERHPFPGPGLALRVLGAVSTERVRIVREADAIFIEELRKSGQYGKVWQALAALLPVKSVGVMGDSRTYHEIIALRAVTSRDAMTADWARLPAELLETVSSRIVNEVKGVNRVLYDVTQKPPATIEYE